MCTINFRNLIFCLPFLLSACNANENKLGCCDPMSINYDPDATIDSGECVYSDALFYMNPDSVTAPDSDGNLIVINESKQPLHLYVNGVRSKLIPAYSNNYLVNIPKVADKCELSIYKVAETESVSNPNTDQIFKKWVVILPTNTQAKNRIKWVISDFATSDGNGEIKFNYPSKQGGFNYTYNTDVYLQSKSGAYMVSLNPGNGYSAKIDYGVYKFYYKYWYSKASDAGATTEVGWLESPYVTLNAAHEILNLTIPGFNAIPASSAKLKIVNRGTESINVYWGQTLIEDLVYGYENTSGLSALSPGHETLYYMDSESNSLITKSFSGVQKQEIEDITLVNNWLTEVNVGQVTMEVYCNNKTSSTMYLGHNNYIGKALKSGFEGFVTLPELDRISVFNNDSTYLKTILINSSKNITIE